MISNKKIFVCSPDLKPLFCLNGVQISSVNYNTHVKDYSTLSFIVDRYVNDRDYEGQNIEFVSSGYDELKIYMYLYLEDIGYFQMQQPRIYNDGNGEHKEVVAYSIEKEFEQKDWLGLKINTGETDSIEYLADNNVDALGFAMEYVTLVNYSKPQLSLLHLMIEKCPGWSIGHVDESIATKKIPYVDMENTNLYALMTSEVGPRMKILFMFDNLNKTINCYDQDSLEYDTDIYISFRNLANKIQLEVDEDSVYTRFRVRGNDDFMLNDWNLNDDMIMDISYFLCEPYMSEDLAQRIKDWMEDREELRVQCANVATLQAQVTEKIYHLNYAVPSNATLWRTWNNMSEEGLDENLRYYQARLRQLQISVDPRSPSEMYSVIGDQTSYRPVTDGNGHVDDEYYTSRLYNSNNEFKGYYTYIEISTYIIPYIQQAKLNLYLPSDQQIKYGTESEENWDLYGYIELDAKRKSIEEDKLPALSRFSKNWNELTDAQKTMYVNEDAYGRAGHNNYVHYVEILGDENTPGTIKYRLQQLKREIAANEADLADYTSQRAAIVAQAQMDQYFNESEINLINTLFIDTDYTNNNILITSIDDVYSSMETEKELYDDSYDMLTRASQPQYKATVELDNLLRLEEFEEWHDNFKLLSYIHVAIREDYSIKLRVIGMTWNPCEITPTLTLEFSNMITSSRGRSDLEDLLTAQNFRGQKNSIAIGKGNANTNLEYIEYLIDELQKNGYLAEAVAEEVENTAVTNVDTDYINGVIQNYLDNVKVNALSELTDEDIETLQNFLKNGLTIDNLSDEVIEQLKEDLSVEVSEELLKSILTNAEKGTFSDFIANNITADTITAELATIKDARITNLIANNITSDIITAGILSVTDKAIINQLQVKVLQGDEAFIKQFFADTIVADEISTKFIQANEARIADIFSTNITAENIATKMLYSDSAVITNLFADKIQAQEVITSFLQASSAAIVNLVATEITSEAIYTKLIDADEASLDKLVSDHIQANTIITKLLQADSASINDLVAQKITATTIYSKFAEIGEAKIDELFANNITSNTVVTKLLEADDARIRDLIAETLTADIVMSKFLQADSAEINDLIVQHLSSDDIVTKLLTADEIDVEELIANRITSETIIAKLLNAEEGAFDNLVSNTVTASTIISKLVDAELGVMDDLISDHLSASTIIGKLLQVEDASVQNLIADNIDASTIVAKLLNADNASFNNLLATKLTAETIITKVIQAESAEFEEFITQHASIDYIESEEIITKLLQAEDADIARIQAKYVTSDLVNSRLLEIDEATINFLNTNIINADNANLKSIIAQEIEAADITAENINVTKISGSEAEFNNFFANHIDVAEIFGNNAEFNQIVSQYVVATTIEAHDIVTELLRADDADVDNLRAKYVNADYIDSTIINAESAVISDLQSKLITTDIINAKLLDADEATINYLTSQVLSASNAELQSIVADIIEVNDVQANSINVGKIVGTQGEFDEFFTNMLNVETVFGNNALFKNVVTESLTANEIATKLAHITQADVGTLFVNNEFANAIQSLSSTTTREVVTDAYIYNAVANKIAVADLLAGDITISDNMRIVSDNGQLIMNGQALQILGTDSNGDPYVGIQLGYDTSDNPSLIVRNEEGNVIISPQGITEDAIGDQLIRNDMIKDGTIDKSKLGFAIVEANENGGVDITQVYDGSGNQFGVEYTSFKNNVEDTFDLFNQKIDEAATYSLHIIAPNGTNIYGGNIILNVVLYKNSVDVTDDFDPSCFVWSRASRDAYGDIYWNEQHSNGAKSLTVTANDVRISADFSCRFEYDDLVIETS